ncbi:RTA-like protein [Penicillium sp. CMV-2018d]|nr:RTA-like protein [Penicillium sp. CMV-2018d]
MSSHAGWIAYEYYPSMGAAVVFIVLFAIVTLMHTFHLFRTRTWFFIPLLIGGYFEVVGYIGRAMSSKQSPDWTIGPYVMQSTLLLIAPALFAASIYMELGRIIIMVKGEQFALIRVNWMTKIFVAGDVLSFLMQASGAGIMVKGSNSTDPSSSSSTGQNVIIGGLIVQIVFFGFFLLTSLIFQKRLGSHPGARAVADQYPWRKHMWALQSSSVLVLIRSVIRVVEYAQGTHGYLMEHEVFIYVFDGLLMFAMMVILVVIHPSEVNYLLGRGNVVTAMGGLKVMEGSNAV